MFIVISLITLGLSVLAEAGKLEASNLRALCARRDVKLTKISQVSSLISHIKETDSIPSCEKVLESIVALEPVLSATKRDACSDVAADKIREYYLKYIEAENGQGVIPPPLRNFFLALGFRISGTCKKVMVNSLLEDANELLTVEDFETMEIWTGDDSPFARILDEPKDFDDLILTSNVVDGLEEAGGPDKFPVQTSTHQILTKIQATCKKRFKPIYEKVILPHVTLGNIGFDYRGEEFQRELDEIASNKRIHQWYTIVYICDSLESIIPIDEHKGLPNEDLGPNVVRILSQEEFEALPESDMEQIRHQPDFGLMQVVYERDSFPIEDELIGDDQDMQKLIKGYSHRRTEIDRINGKIMRKIGQFLKQSLLNGNLKLVSSLFMSKKGTNMNENMLKAIDDFVLSNNHMDQPVAGLKAYGKRVYHNAVFHGPAGIVNKILPERKKKSAKHFWRSMAVFLFILGIVLSFSVGR